MKDIRLTVVQMSSVAGDPEGNLRKMEGFIRDSRGSDVICFHEMCLSGYTTKDPGRYAIASDHSCVERLRSLSKEYDMTIVFGYIEDDSKGLCLRQEIVDDGRTVGFYRKTHLGSREAEFFTPGDELPVFNVRDVNMAIQLCIESHIPDISTVYRRKGAELILMPFSSGISGDRRKEVWDTYLPARASDNGLYVAAVSAVGDNGLGTVFGGGLAVFDPKGRVLAEHYGTDEHSVTVEIGGPLPRDGKDTMDNISYFGRRRPELYL